MSRAHVGCGTHDPFYGLIWPLLIAGLVIMWPVNLALQTLWGCLAMLPWLINVLCIIWWEHVHAPDKMFKTWWP